MLKRVLCLLNLDPSRKFGSLEEQTYSIARVFHKEGSLFLPVFIQPLREKERSEYQTAGLEVTHLDLSRFSVPRLVTLLRLIRDHNIEVVHWNFYHPLNPYFLLVKLLRPSVGHYLTDHTSRTSLDSDPGGALKRTVKRILLGFYSNVLCVSDFILADLKRQNIWRNLSRYYHFINTARFRPDEVVRASVRSRQDADHCFVVLVVAHLIPEKGVDVLVKALAELPSHVIVWVVGEGPERNSLQQLASRLGIDGRVVFLGPQQDVSPYMQAADCFVCPSRWAEAAGLVVMEALACGLPVIASRIGGIPEFVEEGQTGSLFPVDDHKALAKRLLQLVSEPERVKAMRVRARSMAVERFSTQAQLTKLMIVYEASGAASV